MPPISKEEAVALTDELRALVEGLEGQAKRAMYEAVVQFLNERVEHYNWVGIYEVEGEDLVLGAWRGPAPTEHTRIPIGQGICGLAARTGATVNVPDVSRDPRYLQCFLSTKSELVVPIIGEDSVIGEIDIDADEISAFGEQDEEFVEAVARIVANALAILEKPTG